MQTTSLRKDFYNHMYDKLIEVDGLSTSNIYPQYLDEIELEYYSYPMATLKTRLQNENIGNQQVNFRSGFVRLLIYDEDLEALYELYDKVVSKIEENDDELYLVTYNDDEDQLNLDGTKPHYIAIDIEVNIYANGS